MKNWFTIIIIRWICDRNMAKSKLLNITNGRLLNAENMISDTYILLKYMNIRKFAFYCKYNKFMINNKKGIQFIERNKYGDKKIWINSDWNFIFEKQTGLNVELIDTTRIKPLYYNRINYLEAINIISDNILNSMVFTLTINNFSEGAYRRHFCSEIQTFIVK